MEEHSEWDFAKHFSKFNKKKAPIGSRVQEGDALLSDTEAIMSPKKPVVSAGGISAGTGGVQSIVQLDEALAARVEAIAPGPPATDKPPAYTLPKLPPVHTPGSVRAYSRPGETPSFLTQSLEVRLVVSSAESSETCNVVALGVSGCEKASFLDDKCSFQFDKCSSCCSGR